MKFSLLVDSVVDGTCGIPFVPAQVLIGEGEVRKGKVEIMGVLRQGMVRAGEQHFSGSFRSRGA